MLCCCILFPLLLLNFPGPIVAPSEHEERLEDALRYLQKQIQDLDLSIKKSGNRIEIAQEEDAVSKTRGRSPMRAPRSRRHYHHSSPSGREYREYSKVYYNGYDMPLAKTWNKGVGKMAPSLHGALVFKGSKWPGKGTEFEWVHDDRWVGTIRANDPRMQSKKLRISKYMGRTRMGPAEVESVLDEMRRTRFGKNDYHLTKRNCNHFCKELLKHTTGRKLPKRYNRLSRISGKMGLNRIRALG